MAEYQRNIKNVVGVLSGRKKKLIRILKKDMVVAAKNQEFLKAAKLRDQVFGLENIFSHRLFLVDHVKKTTRDYWPKIEKDLKIILNTKIIIARIEGYDISNISGKEAVGSMVVFIDGKPSKKDYRKFKIKQAYQLSDVDMLKEVVSRRFNHPEWPYPDLMLIDGGKTQLNAAIAALRFSIFNFLAPLGRGSPVRRQFSKPLVVALAKREEELFFWQKTPPFAAGMRVGSERSPELVEGRSGGETLLEPDRQGDFLKSSEARLRKTSPLRAGKWLYMENNPKFIKLNSLPPPTAFFLQRVRDEAHRFARVYHHRLRDLSFLK